jgi:hypothetical protein
MGFVTKNQIERARQLKVLDYVLSHEPDSVRRVGSGYRLKEHESLAISDKGFYWHSKGIGGRTALDYLTDVRGYGLVEAVCKLLGEQSYERGEKLNVEAPVKTVTPTQIVTPPERIPLSLPLRHKDNKRVIAYLQSRGIDRDVIMDCIRRGSLYESSPHHSCVFVGRDENGKVRFAAIRGTTSSFKSDVEGSDKRYAFILPPNDPNSREIAVFEGAVDCLSHQTLCKQGFLPPFDGWRLSLGGVSVIALEYFLKQHPSVTHCFICTDNDEAGETAATKIAGLPRISSERSLPVTDKDWNDMLMAVQKTDRAQNRVRKTDVPDL